MVLPIAVTNDHTTHDHRGLIQKMFKTLLISAILIILTLNTTSANAAGDTSRGQILSIICADCHGEDGLGDEDIPAIAGMEAADIRKELMDFKSGARLDENEDMAEIAPDLSEQNIADLAAYFSSLPGR